MEEGEKSFQDFGLDVRLVRALSKAQLAKPTMIQSSVLPFAVKGKDILAKAKTGSGKTLAYLLPLLHRLLTEEAICIPALKNPGGACVRALILVPTLDLARQVVESLQQLMVFCPKEMRVVNLASEESLHAQRATVGSHAAILVSTPSRVLPHLESNTFNLKALQILVVDEADLILGFGFGLDMERIYASLPQTFQSYLMSASITPEVEELKQLILRNAVTFKLENSEDGQENLKQFTIQLLNGKILIFVNDVNRCYRLKLFLDQFGIRSCVLNAELPLASRHSIVEEYNRGVFDLLIASDSSIVALSIPLKSESKGPEPSKKRSKKNLAESRNEFGVARGIDFKRVDVVLNFDLPTAVDSYLHRVGRTARNGNQGTAISFIVESDETTLDGIKNDVVERTGQPLAPYEFDMAQIEGFRYRTQDALRSVTNASIKEARVKDLKKEIVASEKLKAFFELRPKDLELLKHDKNLINPSKVKPHLKHIPEYLVGSAKISKRLNSSQEAARGEHAAPGISPLPQSKLNPSNRSLKTTKAAGHSTLKPKRKIDPLKSVSFKKAKK